MSEQENNNGQDHNLQNNQSDVQIDTRELLNALIALKNGKFDYRMPYDQTGITGKVADTFNEIMEMQESLVNEVKTVARVVGKEGKLSRRFTHKKIRAAAGRIAPSR